MAKSPKIPKSEAEKRRMASERRRSAQERMRAASAEKADAYPPQNFVIDSYPLPVNGVDTGVYAPIFVPHIALKDIQGRYPPRAFLQQLRQALAVHTLIAYHSLTVENRTLKDEISVAEGAATTTARQAFRHVAIDRSWADAREEAALAAAARRDVAGDRDHAGGRAAGPGVGGLALQGL